MKLVSPRERLRILTGTQLLRRRPDWLAAVSSGMIAGAAMAGVVFACEAALGLGVWRPIRLAAAVILGAGAAGIATPDLAVLVVAALVHFALAVFYALVIADATVLMKARAAALAGGAFGACLYALNFYCFTAVFPWFAHSRGWGALLLHAAFGVMVALLYKRLESPTVRKPRPRGLALRPSWRAP